MSFQGLGFNTDDIEVCPIHSLQLFPNGLVLVVFESICLSQSFCFVFYGSVSRRGRTDTCTSYNRRDNFDSNEALVQSPYTYRPYRQTIGNAVLVTFSAVDLCHRKNRHRLHN
jgi:hypothetical protein